MDEFNWRPSIEAVDKCLCSWHSRQLLFGGKALVCNALAISRIWYVASLVHMPSWDIECSGEHGEHFVEYRVEYRVELR